MCIISYEQDVPCKRPAIVAVDRECGDCAGAQAPAWVPLSWKLKLPGIRSQAELGSERKDRDGCSETPAVSRLRMMISTSSPGVKGSASNVTAPVSSTVVSMRCAYIGFGVPCVVLFFPASINLQPSNINPDGPMFPISVLGFVPHPNLRAFEFQRFLSRPRALRGNGRYFL
uniref:Uncharacterized protein n=1 Tax=Candidatus Kentrum eta TaxID=2126337 RepID=A0A450US34_9GAMM|nr:MAG: hypothetical protein BECKH772A_GA0070896_1007214 [Candidatus Kentron sp. H]VFJ95372.1 MAG: hypothetical protein BECKH772B_GA0070898_1007514 [Candidatus Kentron sp. H]VFK01608.1 MAG: hypothetical protein BECKH772C_GA0070978_1006914 [Candidatus Kentron sp. H]